MLGNLHIRKGLSNFTSRKNLRIALKGIGEYIQDMFAQPILRFALLLIAAYVVANLYALWIADGLLFRPRTPDMTLLNQLEGEFKIPTADDAEISAVWLEHPDAPLTLLVSHGNAEDLSIAVPFFHRVRDMGWNVLVYDYRGYGLSGGKASTKNAQRDVSAAYRWLVVEKGIEPKHIVAHGRSLGGAVATWLAARHEVGGLIVESSFTSAFRVKTRIPILLFDKFNSVRSIRDVDCPVLITHGRDDSVLPLWHGKKLFDAAPEPKRFAWFDASEHSNYAIAAEEEYFSGLQSFLEFIAAYQGVSIPK